MLYAELGRRSLHPHDLGQTIDQAPLARDLQHVPERGQNVVDVFGCKSRTDRLTRPLRVSASAIFDFLTSEESERLIAHAEGQWRTMIIVALRTGLRRGELLGLRWEDVDLVNGKLYVRESYVRGVFGTPKSGKPREFRSLTKRGRRSKRIATPVASGCSAMPRVGRSRRASCSPSCGVCAGWRSFAGRSDGMSHAIRSPRTW